MRRLIFSCINAIAGVAGSLLTLVGMGTMRTDHGRVSAIGLILVGLSFLPYRKDVPEWRPTWTGPLALIFALFFIIGGLVVFLISWLPIQ